MLTKLSINGIAFTETQNGVTTSFKVDSITFEENCTAEEAIKVLEAAVNVFKTVRPRNKRRNTRPAKKYHVAKYNNAGYWNCKRFSVYYLVQDRKNQLYLKYIFDDGDTLVRDLTGSPEKLSVYNKKKYIVAEYDCDNFKL